MQLKAAIRDCKRAGDIFWLVVLAAVIWNGCKRGSENEGFREIPKTAAGPVVRVGGSDAVVPVFKTIAQEFERVNLSIHVDFAVPVHTLGGLSGTAEGDYDIGLTARTLSEKEKGWGLQYRHIAQEGISFATHLEVGLGGLSSRQIRDIYAGKITDWSEIGGHPGPIVVLDRPEYTSAKMVVRDKLFGPDLKVTPNRILLERPIQMDETLARVEGALGFTALSSLLSTGRRVTVLDVDNVSPTPRNVSTARYPLWRPIGLVIARPASRATMHFLDFLFGETGRQILLAAGYAPVPASLVVALLPGRETLRQERHYGLMQRYLSRRLGSLVGVKFRRLSAYEDVIEYFTRQEVNAAFLDSYAFLLARSRVELEPLVRLQRQGLSTYRAVIVARRAAGISHWRQLKGKRFGMVPLTAAGDLFPREFFHRHGVSNLASFLDEIVEVETHDAAVLNVLKGKIDAASVKESVYQQMLKAKPSADGKLVVLAVSKPLPEETLVVRRGLESVCFNCHSRQRDGPEFRTDRIVERMVDLPRLLREILLKLGDDEEGSAVLKEFGTEGFKPAGDADFQPVCEMAAGAGVRIESCIRGLLGHGDRSKRGSR